MTDENTGETINWDRYKDFEVLESINGDLREVGNKLKVTFLSNEKLVTAEQISAARKRKGIKSNIKPADSYVFKVQVVGDDKPKQFWLKKTQHTNIRELADIRASNGGSLVNAKAEIEKLQSGDTERPSITIRKL